MRARFQQIIEYKTNGKQKEFAKLMGWSPQYLSRLVSGSGGLGISPVETIIRKIPELNARWFLTGEGSMLNELSADFIYTLLSLEKYIPVMTADEQEKLACGCHFDADTIERWETDLQERTSRFANIFAQAYIKQQLEDTKKATL